MLCGGAAFAQSVPPTGCTTTTCTGSALPSGYLSVAGDQFQNSPGNNVRLACAVYEGTMPAGGFNCVRVDWRYACFTATSPPSGCHSSAKLSTIVARAKAAGLTVIFNHIGNEISTAGSSCVGVQQNGL